MIPGYFISGVGTAAGKTYLCRALARAFTRTGQRVAALKPIETGVTTEPADAVALALACGQPQLAHAPGLYRHPLPLAPYAAALDTKTEPPSIPALAARVHALASGFDRLIVEGAGGLLVPLDSTRTNAELAAAIGLPLLLVARDELGVLSSVLTCVESAAARELSVAAVILTQHAIPDLAHDPSPRTNQRILAERLPLPVLTFGACADSDDALADTAERAVLLALAAP